MSATICERILSLLSGYRCGGAKSDPTHLYVGDSEYKDIKEVAKYDFCVKIEGGDCVKEVFMGMELLKVDLGSYLGFCEPSLICNNFGEIPLPYPQKSV